MRLRESGNTKVVANGVLLPRGYEAQGCNFEASGIRGRPRRPCSPLGHEAENRKRFRIQPHCKEKNRKYD